MKEIIVPNLDSWITFHEFEFIIWSLIKSKDISIKVFWIHGFEFSSEIECGFIFINSWQSLPAAVAAGQSLPAAVVLYLCSPNLPKQCRSSATRDRQLILQSKPTIVFCDSLRGDCKMTCRGSNFDSNLNSAARPTKCEGLSAQKSLKKLCGVWILVESVKDALFLCLSCAGAHCSAAPRARPLSLHSRPSIVFCDSFDQHGLEPWLWLKLELYCLTKDI